jgi:hypothetical protein
MNEQQIKSLLYTIYSAGFNHGSNEGYFPELSQKKTWKKIKKVRLSKIGYTFKSTLVVWYRRLIFITHNGCKYV